MVERRKQPIRNQPNHGSNFRGARAMPRNPFEARLNQSQNDQLTLREQFVKRGRELQKARKEIVEKQESENRGLDPLPADAHEQEIVDTLAANKAMKLAGEPGSGKSTRFPHFTRKAGYDMTIALVPRILIADGLHSRLVDEFGRYLGEDVASQTVGVVHGDRNERHDGDRTLIMTPNTFIRMEKDLQQQYGKDKVVVNADEIHEANLYTEIALGVAALTVSQQESWKLVATSATLNAAVLEDSFTKINNGNPSPTVEIEGRPFDLEMHERPEQSVREVYAEIGADHERTLIFTSGKAEISHIIEQLIKQLEEQERGSSSNVEFRMLHADLNPTMKNYAVSPTPLGKRVVIVATPVAMSGITIPGVTCVITDGTINRPELDEEVVSGTRRRYLAKSEVIQELGRAGRDIDGGVGYIVKPTSIFEDEAREKGKIVDEEDMPYLPFDKRELFGPPEIYNTNLRSVELGIAANGYQFSEVNEYLPHPVQESDILKAEEGLYRIGALQPDDDKNLFVISPIGLRMNEFPVRPELTRGLIEAQNNNRSLLQMARLALIIAAVEAGGLQEYTKDAGDNWREFLRDTTSDDMFAQYDLMTALPFSHEDDISESFVARHDLSYRHVERALKVSRQILKKLGINRRNIVLSPPNQTEEDEIRNDLTAGLIDSVYRKAGYHQKRQMYRNIHGAVGSTERYVSDRSIVSSHEHEYVAGMPRWFIRGRNTHNIVELAMPVDPAVVAKYAMKNNILDRVAIGAKMIDGAVTEQYQMKFGSINVGGPKQGDFTSEVPAKFQETLVQYVLANQGPAQKALREVVSELERYKNRVPESELKKRLKVDSGMLLTAEKIEQEIRNAAKKTRIAYEVDRALNLFIYQANIGIGRYFTEEAREELISMSPDEFEISASNFASLQYESPEKPYITMPHTDEAKAHVRTKSLRLPDGREVFIKRTDTDGTSEFISAKSI